MSLVPKWSLSFSDSLVVATETTGNYSVSNPEGYGSPNPEFADFEHLVIIKKKNVNSVADEQLSVVYTPQPSEGIGEASATRATDGWHETTNINIPFWDSGTSYSGSGSSSLSDYVSKDGTLYRALTNSTNQDPAAGAPYWQAITLEDLLNLNLAGFDNNVYVTIEGRVTAFDADVYYANRIAEKTQLGFAGVTQTDRDKERLDTIYRTIQQVLVADQLGNNTDGEWCVLRLRQMGAKREE